MTNLADLAIRYSQQFKADVIPVVPEGKCPPKGMTRNRASQNPDLIRRMFTDHPDCGIGMIIPERLVVFDLERDGAGKPLGGLPPTAVAKSRGRTGRHYFFRTFRRIPTRIRIRKDVDILGPGHIVVLPSTNDPERHWMIAPEDEQLALAPSWLRELAQERPRRQRQPLSMPSAPDRSGIGERTELGDLLTEFFTEERNLREIPAHLGMPRDAEIGGRSFSCPCCPEQRASASLWRAKNGQIVVEVWHAARDGGGGKWNCPANEYSLLAEISHAQQTREWRKLEGAELAAWSLRLVRDARVVRLKNAQPQLPGLPRNARYLVQQFAEVIDLAEALAGSGKCCQRGPPWVDGKSLE